MFVGLSVRLFYWQVIKGADLSQEARGQYKSSKITEAPRGNILASDGSYWVLRTDAFLVYVNPEELESSSSSVAEKLAPFFVEEGDDRQKLIIDEVSRLKGLLSKKDSSWVPLKDRVSLDVKKNIEALKITGIGFEKEQGRFYPEASSAAQLLGFVGKDENGSDIGYFGLEGYYSLPLSGKSGFLGGEKDAKGSPILLGGSKEVSAISGVDLQTNIDKRVQIVLDEKLKEGIEKYGAKGGTVIAMDPKTGAVLGMSSSPSYDPAKYWEYGDSYFKNPAISDSFEPGSIFKVLVMSAGLDAGVIEPDTICDICDKPLKVDKYSIETWNNKYHSDSSMTDVIVNSDNVGMAFIGQKLGADKLYDYLANFGIGSTTGIDLQGEGAPQLRKRGTWNIVDLATASFGQGVATTPIQMLRAVSAVANGGYLVTPRVVKSIKSDGWEDNLNKDTKKERVISEKAAKETTAMMLEAVERGEAKWTKLPGFKVAGKTGTAQIPIAGHYDASKTNASFIAFAPAGNPKFAMIVTLKEPQTSPWAAETAAPLWFSIAKDLFPYFGIQPEN